MIEQNQAFEDEKLEDGLRMLNEMIPALAIKDQKMMDSSRQALCEYLRGDAVSIEKAMPQKGKVAKELFKTFVLQAFMPAPFLSEINGEMKDKLISKLHGAFPTASICPECGKLFINRKEGQRQKTYCSLTCQKRRNEPSPTDRRKAYLRMRVRFHYEIEENRRTEKEAIKAIKADPRYQEDIKRYGIKVDNWKLRNKGGENA